MSSFGQFINHHRLVMSERGQGSNWPAHLVSNFHVKNIKKTAVLNIVSCPLSLSPSLTQTRTINDDVK